MENSTIKKFKVAELSIDQKAQLAAIEQFIQAQLNAPDPNGAVGVINGKAGTGKSVILTKLFENLQNSSREARGPYVGTHNVFTVNHPELLKVYQELAATEPNLRKKDYQRPTSIINEAHKHQTKYDVILIDEGHLLLSKSEPYIKFFQDNQLSELIKLAKVVIVVFDFEQVMQSKAYWSRQLLDAVTAQTTRQDFDLDLQYRVQANPAILQWIDALSHGSIQPIPDDLGSYDLRIYERADAMYNAIKARDAEYGLARIVATSGFKPLANGRHDVYMDNFDLPWDEYDPQKTPWAERPESIAEVGSIYTIQGFDLNYAGVILGPPFGYDSQQNQMIVHTDTVTHREIYKKTPHLTKQSDIQQMQADVMYHAASILMTRGVRGLYLTAADANLRAKLLQLKEEWEQKHGKMDGRI